MSVLKDSSIEQFFTSSVVPRISELGLDLDKFQSFELPGEMAGDIGSLRKKVNDLLLQALPIKTAMEQSTDANLKQIRDFV